MHWLYLLCQMSANDCSTEPVAVGRGASSSTDVTLTDEEDLSEGSAGEVGTTLRRHVALAIQGPPNKLFAVLTLPRTKDEDRELGS
jgi:hypothetical protein